MIPRNFKESNMLLRAPDGMDEVKDLRVFYQEGDPQVYISCWKPTFLEKICLLFGGRVWLHIVGKGHPPVALETTNPFEKTK